MSTILAILAFCTLTVALAACSFFGKNEDGLKLKDGSTIPTEITMELGELFMVPEVDGGEEAVTYTVKDSDGNEVRVNNDKFRANDLRGYTLAYTVGEKIVSVTLKVQDTTAPTIGFSVPDGMAVIRGSSFVIPACSISDTSKDGITSSVSVVDESGNPVTVTDNRFEVTDIGVYTIMYTATDASGNTGSKNLTVSCENADLLNAFEAEDSVGYISFTAIKEVVAENAATDNGLKLTVNDETNAPYRRICIPLKKTGEYLSYEDLLKYEKVQLYAYMSEDNELGLANQTYAVKKGVNVIVFTRAQIEAAYAFSSAQYKANTEGFYLNFRYPTNGAYMILDNFIGIYARDYVPEAPPAYTMEIFGMDGMTAIMNESFNVPACNVVDTDGNELSYEVSVVDGNGNAVNLTDGAFVPTAIGEYVITYTITAEGITGLQSIKVNCKKAKLLNDFSALEDLYGIGGFTSENVIVTEGNVDGSALKMTATSEGSWVQIYSHFEDLTEESGYMSWDNVQKFEKLQMYVWSNLACEISLANGSPRIALEKGWNLVEFSMNAILASYGASDYTYRQNGGFYVTIPTVTEENIWIFDSIIGIYADDYVETESETKEPVMTVYGINGITANYGEEFILPKCVVTNAKGDAVAYTVAVTDKDGNTVNIVDNKFTANVLGTYTVTYTAEGFEAQTITVNCKKALVLNKFIAISDMTYIGGWNGYIQLAESENTLTDGGLKVIADSKACSWGQFYFYLKDANGYMTWANVQKLEKLQIYIYASAAGGELCHPAGSPRITIHQGWNVIEISIADLIAAEAQVSVYQENANGLQMMVTSIALGEYVIFDQVVGVYADDYMETEEETKEPTMTVYGINGMMAVYGETFTLPACVVTDENGETVAYTVTVTDKDGNSVTVTDNKFTANVLGEYTVTYTAEGFEAQTLTLNCKKGLVLNSFEATSDVTYIGGWSGNTVTVETENTITGGGLKVGSETSKCSWAQIYIPLKDANGYITWENLQKFEKIQIYMYATADAEITFANGSPRVALKTGWNIVEFSKDVLVAANSAVAYAENANGLYLTIPSLAAGEYVIFDQFIGVYADDYMETEEETKEPTMTVYGINGMMAVYGETFTLPACVVTDENGETVAYTVTVTDKDGNSVTVTDNKFTANVLGEYTVTYTAEGFEAQTLTLNCKKGLVLNSFEATSDVTYIGGWSGNTVTVETENTITGGGLKVGSETSKCSWAQIYIPLKDANGYITWENLQKFEKIQIYMYATADAEITFANGSPRVALKAGWNIVEFSKDALVAANSAVAYAENANGLYLTIPSLAAGEYVIFDQFVGIYADDYTEVTNEA